jgi:hypothetical protein
MGQREVLEFLNKHKGEYFTSCEIAAKIESTRLLVSASLKKLAYYRKIYGIDCKIIRVKHQWVKAYRVA